MNNPKAEKEAIQWLTYLNSPELSDNKQRAFFEWMESSPANQCAYIQAEKLWEQGSVYAQVSEPEPLIQQWITQKQFLAVACSLALTVACTALFYFDNTSIIEQEFYTTIGEQKEYKLDDGSTILLNTDTALRTQLLKNKRIAYVDKGEVFFNIAKDKNRPFDVITPSGKVRVVGTQFSVYNQGDDSVVTVIEGKVSLGDVTLIADQRLTMKAAKQGASPKTVNAKAKLSWRKHELVYRGEPLENVIRDINRYFNEEITLADSTLKTKEVIAVIHLDNVAAATSILARSLNLKVNINPTTAVIILDSN